MLITCFDESKIILISVLKKNKNAGKVKSFKTQGAFNTFYLKFILCSPLFNLLSKERLIYY